MGGEPQGEIGGFGCRRAGLFHTMWKSPGPPSSEANGLDGTIHLFNRSSGSMADRQRRGMLIKNSGDDAVRVDLSSRELRVRAGEERFITPREVREASLRRALQERSLLIVRPATRAEEEALQERLDQT